MTIKTKKQVLTRYINNWVFITKNDLENKKKRLDKKLNPRDKYYLKTKVGRVLIAGTNIGYNQRLETY